MSSKEKKIGCNETYIPANFTPKKNINHERNITITAISIHVSNRLKSPMVKSVSINNPSTFKKTKSIMIYTPNAIKRNAIITVILVGGVHPIFQSLFLVIYNLCLIL